MKNLEELEKMFGPKNAKDTAKQTFVERKAHGGELSLLLLEIKNLGQLKEKLGHAEHNHELDNQLIQAINKMLNKISRDTDCVGRFGPQEFLIVCKDTNAQSAELFAQRIGRELAQVDIEGAETLTCKFGVSELTIQNDLEEMIDAAKLNKK